jgi:hypothetical protein
MSLAQQIRASGMDRDDGEMGALLLEAQLIKRWQPIHNRRLRRSDELCTWRLLPTERDGEGGYLPELAWARDLDWGRQDAVYGLFGSQRDALKTLREIAERVATVSGHLGPGQRPRRGGPVLPTSCTAAVGRAWGRSHGAGIRPGLRTVLSDWQVRVWPYGGPVQVREGDAWHVLDAWCYLGTARTADEVQALLEQGRPTFDKDTYKILAGRLPGMTVEPVPVLMPSYSQVDSRNDLISAAVLAGCSCMKQCVPLTSCVCTCAVDTLCRRAAPSSHEGKGVSRRAPPAWAPRCGPAGSTAVSGAEANTSASREGWHFSSTPPSGASFRAWRTKACSASAVQVL